MRKNRPPRQTKFTRRTFCAAGLSACGSGTVTAQQPQPAPPTLDELATGWLDCAQLAHMPSLHNFHEMAACAPDLVGVNFLPGHRIYKASGPRWFIYNTLPLCRLAIDGRSPDAEACRWFPYQAMRRAEVDDLEILTTNRLASEANAILWRVRLRNRGSFSKFLAVSIFWDASSQIDPSMKPVYRFFDSAAARTESRQQSAESEWQLQLDPGATRELRFQLCVDTKAGSFTQQQTDSADWFESQWSRAKQVWEERWKAAFTPGNHFFSGNAPLLLTNDTAVREIYYRSVLTLLVLLRTNAWSNRTFITSGERGKIVYYWDTSLFSTIFALLEPNQLKEQVKFFLEQDPHKGADLGFGDRRPSSPVKTSAAEGWDLHGYAANDVSIFRLAYSYLSVTGDTAFLSERIADQTVLERLHTLATNWRKLLLDPTDRLADYGGAGNLLECVPTYIHKVPSFNAANVSMMRELAGILEQSGNTSEADALRSAANYLSRAVLDLYVPGAGVWCSLHRDGTRVEMRHCYDFASVGRFMPDDLSRQVRDEMVAFVRRELLTENWMRAQSLLDVAAARSDRPDHGPMGAYDAWPAVTVDAMCNLGDWREGIAFLRSTQGAVYEGVYAQARELYGPDKLRADASVRIAQRRGCMRECCGGGAFAETIVSTLFGYRPTPGSKLELFEPKVSRQFVGELRHVRHASSQYTLRSTPSGLTWTQESELG